jgi:threonine synthase
MAVQAEGSNAIALALANDCAVSAVRARSIADSITVDLPRNGVMAVRDVRESGGRAVEVSDEEILRAAYELASTSGIFAEPAAAAALAGLRSHIKEVDPVETIILLVTGSGLKDVDSASRAAPAPIAVEPSLEALQAALD